MCMNLLCFLKFFFTWSGITVVFNEADHSVWLVYVDDSLALAVNLQTEQVRGSNASTLDRHRRARVSQEQMLKWKNLLQ